MTMRRVDGRPERSFVVRSPRSWGYWFVYNRYLRRAKQRDIDNELERIEIEKAFRQYASNMDEAAIVGEPAKCCRVETDMTPAPIGQHKEPWVPLVLVAMLVVLSFGALMAVAS
jgi:hypothetical protein